MLERAHNIVEVPHFVNHLTSGNFLELFLIFLFFDDFDNFHFRRGGSFNEAENCYITSLEARFADGLSDFIPDPEWDIYQQQTDSDLCKGGATRQKPDDGIFHDCKINCYKSSSLATMS